MKKLTSFLLLIIWILVSIVLALSIYGALGMATLSDFWFKTLPNRLLNVLIGNE